MEGVSAHRRCSPGLRWVYGTRMGACMYRHSGVWASILAVPVAGSMRDTGIAGMVMSVPGDAGLRRHSLPPGPSWTLACFAR